VLVLNNLGHMAEHLGDLRHGAACFGEGLGLSEEYHDRLGIAYCLAGMAGIARQLGRPELAARLLGAVDAMIETSGVVFEPVELAEAERHRAATRRQLGDAAFDAAWTAGRRLSGDEAMADAARFASEVASLPAPGQSAVADSILSQRERDVIRLLVDGRSDREIADELFISTRTASNHVRNILNKLGVDNRTAAATYAVRQELA
jgi:DNA-binding CsgD family transcriptional regulator